MEDRDGKKPFIIPKTHTSNNEVLINEKPDSRNVTELFNDIRSCALEAQFDFRQSGCKSCDTIRNPKLQKLYNERRIKMKKDQDVTERLAFHLITYRGVATSVATNGLSSEQLSFPIDKYLGNPKDGVHLCRRPDVLLTSSGNQGLYRFGLLVCKILLGKGYATIPSTSNNQLSAQVHYDHHFCKMQSINKAQQNIEDLLANSLIFCYEHENFETIPHPSQILPIAILWYDLTDRFSPELIPTLNHESQYRNGKIINGGKLIKKKTTNPLEKNEISMPNSGVWEGPPKESSSESSTPKYPSHFMIPYHRVYSTPSVLPSLNVDTTSQQQSPANPIQSIDNSRDPRLLRTKRQIKPNSSDTVPLSPQHLLSGRSLSDGSTATTIKSLKVPSDELVLITKSTSTIYIPLNSSGSLLDPRLKTSNETRPIFFLESQSVKHALQQQKRLNHYYDPKSGLPPKTSYTLIPFQRRQVSMDEYERWINDDQNTYKITKHSNGMDYSALHISVIDCFNFGFIKNVQSDQMYIDLEQSDNQLAYEQIEISNQLIQRESQLNSQQIRLRLREKRQRRIQQQQQHINEKKIREKQDVKSSSVISPLSSNSKLHVTRGRQLLREHPVSTTTPNTYLSSDILDFFTREYQNESRSHVKHLLAELTGIWIEKYQVGEQDAEANHSSTEEPITDDQTVSLVIDMDLGSPLPQELHDHDERFPESTLPSSSNEPALLSSVSSVESNNDFNDPDYQIRCQNLVEQLQEYRSKQFPPVEAPSTTKSDSVTPTDEVILKACFEQLESTSSELSVTDENPFLAADEELPPQESLPLPTDQTDSNRSLDELVKLLEQEAYVKKSPSPSKNFNMSKQANNYSKHHQRSYDRYDRNHSFKPSHTYRRYALPLNKKPQLKQSSQKKISSNRTVLLTQRSTSPRDTQQKSQDEPKSKRLKTVSSALSPINTPDDPETITEIHSKDSDVESIVTISANNGHHDCRYDLNKKRRIDSSDTNSSRSRSDSKSRRDYHSEERQRSSRKDSKVSSQLKTYSRSSSSSKDNSHRHSQFTRDNHHQPAHDRYESSQHRQRQQGPHKRFNYNHQSITHHPRFAHTNPPSSHSTSSRHGNTIPTTPVEDQSTESLYYQDNYPETFASSTRTCSNSFASDPFNTIK